MFRACGRLTGLIRFTIPAVCNTQFKHRLLSPPRRCLMEKQRRSGAGKSGRYFMGCILLFRPADGSWDRHVELLLVSLCSHRNEVLLQRRCDKLESGQPGRRGQIQYADLWRSTSCLRIAMTGKRRQNPRRSSLRFPSTRRPGPSSPDTYSSAYPPSNATERQNNKHTGWQKTGVTSGILYTFASSSQTIEQCGDKLNNIKNKPTTTTYIQAMTAPPGRSGDFPECGCGNFVHGRHNREVPENRMSGAPTAGRPAILKY